MYRVTIGVTFRVISRRIFCELAKCGFSISIVQGPAELGGLTAAVCGR